MLGALGVPLISSLNGHAAAQGGAWIFLRVAVDWLHAAAVGIWTGGLWSLHAWLGSKRGPERMDDDQTSALEGVRRFSRWAAASTGVIAATGVLMAVWAGVDLAHPWRGGAYGRLVLAKTALFAGTLGVAGVNQFIHLRGASSPTLRMPEDSFRRRVRREVRFELILVGITLIVAGFLTRSDFP